jgi:hypothetical protein
MQQSPSFLPLYPPTALPQYQLRNKSEKAQGREELVSEARHAGESSSRLSASGRGGGVRLEVKGDGRRKTLRFKGMGRNDPGKLLGMEAMLSEQLRSPVQAACLSLVLIVRRQYAIFACRTQARATQTSCSRLPPNTSSSCPNSSRSTPSRDRRSFGTLTNLKYASALYIWVSWAKCLLSISCFLETLPRLSSFPHARPFRPRIRHPTRRQNL